jgi:hypothetical protein
MRIKIISSLEKCFPDESILKKRELKSGSMLKNERYSFQVCYQMDPVKAPARAVSFTRMEIDSPIASWIRVRRVQFVPSQMPAYTDQVDDNLLRTEPGLFPDPLMPMGDDRVAFYNSLNALWVDVEGECLPTGEYPITFRFRKVHGATGAYADEVPPVEATVLLRIINACLPKQTTKVTNWFHCDCLQTYYGTGAFDERHWNVIEEFLRTAVRNGVNMILTPLVTPPLDTRIGGERPTMQLVDIRRDGDRYSFDFTKLERWVKLCDRVGVEYFEVSHLFTQWGALHCPKVIATVDGEVRQIFGWDSNGAGEEYAAFLGQLIPAFLNFMKSMNGADQRCYFHVSDEPSSRHLENYKKVRNILKPLVEGYPVFDALSHVEYYDSGLVDLPVPAIGSIDTFLEREIPERWVYYCCGLDRGRSNRFFTIPSCRNRILGAQMYKFGVKGFLQWGYNFYYNQFSYQAVDPWICTDGEGFAPSGDAFVVYPGKNGCCIESLRLKVFYDGLQDQRAMELCEKLYGKEFVVKLIDEETGTLAFDNCPKDPETVLRIRGKINDAIYEMMREEE